LFPLLCVTLSGPRNDESSTMVGAEILVVEVSTRPKSYAPRSTMVDSYGCWSGTISCDPVTSKDPCWSSFRLSGGGGGSSVTSGRPRSLHDRRIL
jgi:hypothetical protein